MATKKKRTPKKSRGPYKRNSDEETPPVEINLECERANILEGEKAAVEAFREVILSDVVNEPRGRGKAVSLTIRFAEET